MAMDSLNQRATHLPSKCTDFRHSFSPFVFEKRRVGGGVVVVVVVERTGAVTVQ